MSVLSPKGKAQAPNGAPRGRPPTPCPRCGEGQRQCQVVVQARMLDGSKGGGSSSVSVCASCAGQLRAELTILLEGAVSDQ